MKILYIVPNPNRIGGVSRSIQRVVHYLKSNGLDVKLFCPDFEAENGVSKSEMMMMKELLTGSMMQEWTQRVIDKMKTETPDLVVGYYGSSAAYCATAAAKFLDIPVIACFRGNDINRDFFSSFHAPKLNFVAQNATAITTVSSEMKEKVRTWLGVEANFISNSVDKSIFYNRKKLVKEYKQKWNLGNRAIVGLFGEFKASRGLELLDHLKGELQNVQTIIVGKVRSSIQKQLPDYVTVIPYINQIEELTIAYSLCDVVFQPSKYDGMPNVVLEAMACERIVLASPTGGIKDLINHGENGYLCSTNDDWKNNLKLALNNTGTQIGKMARESVPEPKEEAAEFISLFSTILKKNKAHYN
ncbi:MAG: glycosyltransferase family 4 protein [Flavobacteriaceae bacterium]|nr:glycosyltransferase family 4 protein [Flavobacteriaceae bacterium]